MICCQVNATDKLSFEQTVSLQLSMECTCLYRLLAVTGLLVRFTVIRFTIGSGLRLQLLKLYKLLLPISDQKMKKCPRLRK